MDKYFFVGHFSSAQYQKSLANSPAGNQVQLQILDEINAIAGHSNVSCYSMQPIPAWPKGDFIVRTKKEYNIVFLGFINLLVVKNLLFSLHLFYYLFKIRPRYCVQYNSYLFENLSLIIYRSIVRSSRISAIIQDINCNYEIKFSQLIKLNTLIERLGLSLLNYFDFLVPISNQLASDFKLKNGKYFVFQGGLTSYSLKLLSSKNLEQQSGDKFAVFAGVIESYNGVDKLIEQWIIQEIKYPLHIFGKGSLSDYVLLKSKDNQYVIYHGFQSEEIVEQWLLKAQWNFCLRYSILINQNYFFPSKFFNLICLKGALICNNFNNLPPNLHSFIILIDDELVKLSEIINSTINTNFTKKSELCKQNLIEYHSWEQCIEKLIKCLSNS
jgi:glycosyltransferase involved in cell wall biosynthesis